MAAKRRFDHAAPDRAAPDRSGARAPHQDGTQNRLPSRFQLAQLHWHSFTWHSFTWHSFTWHSFTWHSFTWHSFTWHSGGTGFSLPASGACRSCEYH